MPSSYSAYRTPVAPFYHHTPSAYNGAMVAPVGPHFYQSASSSNAWQCPYPAPAANGYWPHPPPPSIVPTPAPAAPVPASEPVPVEQQQAATIRNLVNVKKATIQLEEDEANPGFHLVAFSFDAAVEGSISIFLFAKEGANCSLSSMKSHIYEPVRVAFQKGLGQKFRQAPGTGVNFSLFDAAELAKEGPEEVIPLAIRAETVPKDSPLDSSQKQGDSLGSQLPKWVNSQITQAIIQRKDNGDYRVRVLRQIIWVDGVRYELQEIYGIEPSVGGGGGDDNDFGKECVICMSEPRDTTVLPCRHMCMCRGCANVLKAQMNRCPICRQHVDRFLEIKVNS